ncbi:hypothetical protein IWQ56_005599, partial [Coemansia nantahalensis]
PPPRNGSPFGTQLLADPAVAQRVLGPSHASAGSTRTNSPAPGGLPYANGDGFDSSSEHIYLGGPAMGPQRQAPPSTGSVFEPSGSVFEPSAPPLPIAAAGQFHEHQPVYRFAGSGETMAMSDSDLVPPPGAMRPWTESSRSLPLAAPAP